MLPDPSLAIGTITWDKIDHAIAYSGLSLLLMLAYRHHRPLWQMSLIVLLTCTLVGVLLEYCQLWFTSTREFSYYDALANSVGAAIGIILFWCYALVDVEYVK